MPEGAGRAGPLLGLLLLLPACAGAAGDTGVHALSPTTPADEPPGPRLALPLAEPERFDTVVGVDHDPEVQGSGLDQLRCWDYAERGFPHCYDEHDGSDYILRGGFDAMDAGSSPVIAAAAGRVSLAVDGNYDRCHGDLSTGENDCDGHEMAANLVELTHEDGWVTRYLHLARDSVAVAEGDEVSQGQHLGLVGSSGNSFTPHLHLEVWDEEGVVVDPYAGPASQSWSLWCDQGDEDDLPGGCGGG